MKKNKKYFAIILLIISMFITSCEDDPVKPKIPPALDTIDVYDWTIDTIYGYNCGIVYAADSDNVFISAYPKPLYYNGSTYQPMNLMDPLYISLSIAGYDKDNVFFGGGISGTYWGDPVLKKWTSGNIDSYTLTGDSGVGITRIFIEGTDECWFSTTERYKVYHFNGGTFDSYTLDSGCRAATFFKDISGTLYAFAIKPLGMYDVEHSYFRFSNESFQLFGRDTVTQTSEISYYGPFVCGRDLLRSGRNSIFYFNGSGWEKLCNTLNFRPYMLDGISKDNFLCYGQSQAGPWEIYTWNGANWKRERNRNIYHYLADATISITNTTVEIILFVSGGLNYHLRGKLKKEGI
jgi:hypothetical protein